MYDITANFLRVRQKNFSSRRTFSLIQHTLGKKFFALNSHILYIPLISKKLNAKKTMQPITKIIQSGEYLQIISPLNLSIGNFEFLCNIGKLIKAPKIKPNNNTQINPSITSKGIEVISSIISLLQHNFIFFTSFI